MNRNIYILFAKSIFALFIVLASNKAFATITITTAIQNGGDFNNPQTWDNGLPSALSNNDIAIIPANITVTIAANTSAPNLIIEAGGTLNIFASNGPITTMINNKLIMKGSTALPSSIINFAGGSITFIVTDSLIGAVNSTISLYPPNGTTQKLILKGKLNTLDNLINNLNAGGSSIVSYEGPDQKIFPSDNYATLLIGGTGVKTLSAESFNTGTVTSVSKRLHLNTTLKLGMLDLIYQGTKDSLGYKDGINFNGWIWTDAAGGMLKIANGEANRTFPVGDGVTMKELEFIGIDNKTNLELGVRYNVSEPNVVITPNGVGPWYINSNKGFKATVTLINPIVAPATLSAPRFAISSSNGWILPNNSQLTSRGYQSTESTIYSGNNYVALFDCSATITPTTLPVGYQGRPYSSGNLVLSQERAPYLPVRLDSTPLDFGAGQVPTQTKNTFEITGTPNSIANYTAVLTVRDTYNCEISFNYTISVITPPSPNLYITPIDAKTYGDADFKLSSYTKNTAVPVVYSISPNTCAELVSGNMVHIKCAGPVPNNSITVTATQAASGVYKGESVSTTFFINKAQSRLSIKNTGFLPNTTGALIYEKTSDSLPKFTQLTRPDLATVSQNGQLTTFGSTGTFSVSANIVATDNYTAFDSIYTFTIYTTKQAPLAINDTIIIQMGQDTTFNLLVNDYGITDPINSTLTDIDLENAGIQKKYYSTSLGTFNIDPAGILAIHPFEGFIGTDKIAYTVTDEAGLVSNVAYLIITVEPPVKIPALKANEVMTPNNDGLNDALVIANTNLESENSLVITDETGNVVFEQDNYRNDWKGTNKKGSNLESGVYFYVFTEKHSGRMLQNYLQIAGY